MTTKTWYRSRPCDEESCRECIRCKDHDPHDTGNLPKDNYICSDCITYCEKPDKRCVKCNIGESIKNCFDNGDTCYACWSDVVIGDNCVLRHCTTIGNKGIGLESKSPVIGNNCDIGSNVVIIGDVNLGDNASVGAGSVIVKSVPSNSIVVGNPGRIIKK